MAATKPAAVQAHGTDDDTCMVAIAVNDAIVVGETLRALTHNSKAPDHVKVILLRVGAQLASAGKAANATKIAKAVEYVTHDEQMEAGHG